MKLAALSDIHSNAYALEAVIGDAIKRSVDIMLNLGDIFYGPIAPRATYDLLMQHEFVTICGNQDRQIYETPPNDIKTNPTLHFVRKDLGNEPLNWLRSLPFGLQLSERIYLCHGTPASDLTYLLENVETGSPRVRHDTEIIKLLKGEKSEVIFCGHSHIPRTVELNTNQLVINPGSVGLPAYTDETPVPHSMENFSHHASYAILEEDNAGWTVQHIKVAYDYHQAAEDARKRHRYDWGHFLATGKRV